MMSAKDIALSAYEQAKAAAYMEDLHEEALEMDRKRAKDLQHKANLEAALPKLNEWFPGVEWDYFGGGDYQSDTIVHDASEEWPWSFMLCVKRLVIDLNDPSAGYRIEIQVGDYVQDTSMQGYSYFSGSIVKSAADVGRYLERKNA